MIFCEIRYEFHVNDLPRMKIRHEIHQVQCDVILNDHEMHAELHLGAFSHSKGLPIWKLTGLRI